MKDYVILIGFRFFKVDSNTLDIKCEFPDRLFDEFEFKVPRIIDNDLMMYLISEKCFKIFYNGYEFIFEVKGSNFSFYMNGQYCYGIYYSTEDTNKLCVCRLGEAVFVSFYTLNILIFGGKAYLVTCSVSEKLLLSTVIDLDKLEYGSILTPYRVRFAVNGIRINSKQFKRKMVLGG